MNYSERIDALTQEYVSSFEGLSTDVLNFKPKEKIWSINQIIDHVTKLNKSYFPIFEEIQNGKFSTPIIGNFRFFANYLGKKILESVDIKNKKKTKTTGIWQPQKTKIDDNVLDEFVETQDALKEYITNMDKWIKRNTVIHSPASNNIVYPLSDAIDIIIMHEARHLRQAQERKTEVQ